jgi:hypothetical protein
MFNIESEVFDEDRYKNDNYRILLATDLCKKEIIDSFEKSELNDKRLTQIKYDLSELLLFIIKDNKPKKLVRQQAKEALNDIENWLVNKKII